MAKLVDLSMPAPEGMMGDEEGPYFPCGTCLCLDEETLAKLGIDGSLLGAEVRIEAVGRVTNASADAAEGDTERMSIQITQMAVDASGQRAKAAAASLYPSAADDD